METSTEVVLKEDLQNKASGAVERAGWFVVIDNTSNKEATDYLKTLKDFQVEIKLELRPAIQKAHELHRTLTGQEKRLLEPLLDAEKVLRNKITDYLQEEKRKQDEEQKKLQLEAEAKERKRREELEKQAKAHEEKGNIEKAEERREMAEQVHVPVPVVPETVDKQQGITMRDNWKSEVIDPEAAVRAVFDGHLPKYCVKIDEKALGQLSKLEKKERTQYGVRFFNDKGITVRA